jgi:5S rRNA maturation endonuclease (ribonuclease M5)
MTNRMMRVTASSPCPVCRKRDWCLRSRDGNAAICARVESQRPIQRRGRDRAGFLHILPAEARVAWQASSQVENAAPAPAVNIDWPKLAATFTSALMTGRLTILATSLGVSIESLLRLNAGWATWHRAYSFPMRSADGSVVGIRLRKPTGFKFCVRGSRSALFIPEGLVTTSPLCITEGPTDCAALLDMGLVAVGRPSSSGGISLLRQLVRRLFPREVIILADGDEPGQTGAKALANELSELMVELRITTPPAGIKDARDWKHHGATASDILAAPALTFPHPAIRQAQRHAVDHRRRQRA